MLTQLSIKNYALIESLSVDFQRGLSTITGETGAGKSILLGALSLVLGKRADLSTLKDTSKKCVVEACFSINNPDFIAFFEENELDFEQETIIRREILPSGKSRAFINDTPTTLQILNSLSEKLIDIHSQHETLLLGETDFQFQLIDALAKNEEKIASYKRGLQLLKKLQTELHELETLQQQGQEQFDYHSFLFNELSEADLKEDEQEFLEEKLDSLNHIEEIKSNLCNAQQISENEEFGLQTQLNIFLKSISNISKFSKKYEELYERINSVKIEVDDISAEIENENENLELHPEEIEKYNDRLQLIYDLQKKHHTDTISELLEIQQDLEKKLDTVSNSNHLISEKKNEIEEVKQKIDGLALKINAQRKKSIPIFIKKLEELLHHLNMKNTQFQIQINHCEQYFSQGKDELEFLVSTNKGASFGSLKKIASGGELSRIMLSVKAILSQYLQLPTIIFDEIDTGVSGEIAKKMATIMSDMAQNMQVITITHLPQIAVKGQQHYKVYKEEIEQQTHTKLKQLTTTERITEIAEMLEGKQFSETAMQHAKRLLGK
ncbi:MAG: DNA repair protein RecN [Flavobacteriaceae bacterium]|nr:DNA repair protein RecN [Flavobacteriaceae bacterium]